MLFGYKIMPLSNATNETQFQIRPTIENESITRVDSTKFLGVIVDQKLTWQQHITYFNFKTPVP